MYQLTAVEFYIRDTYLAFVVDVGKDPFAAVRGDTVDLRDLSSKLSSMVDCC